MRIPEQSFFDEFIEKKSNHRRRQESCEHAFGNFKVQDQRAPIKHDHREDGPELNRDLEALEKLRGAKAQEFYRKDQVAGRRDWKEFGDAFHDPKDYRMQKIHAGHYSIPACDAGDAIMVQCHA